MWLRAHEMSLLQCAVCLHAHETSLLLLGFFFKILFTLSVFRLTTPLCLFWSVSSHVCLIGHHTSALSSFPEGVYKLRAVVHDVHGSDVELGPYYMNIGHENVSVFMNSSSIHEGEALSLANSLPQQKGETCALRSLLCIEISAVHAAWLGFSFSVRVLGTLFYTVPFFFFSSGRK